MRAHRPGSAPGAGDGTGDEYGAGTGSGAGGTLAGGVLAQARRTPAAPAVVDGERVLDYAELERRSRAVARGLRESGVGAGHTVAVCLPRSWQLVCVLLGIRRAAATAVPLDAQSPAERRRHILSDSGAEALVHDGPEGQVEGRGDGQGDGQGGPGAVRGLSAAALLSTADGPLADVEPGGDAAVSFLFYTSGTTGRPKGVEVRDAGVLRLARPGWLSPAEGERYACAANPAFDALSFEVWVPLLTGGTCVVLGDAQVQSPGSLAEALRAFRVDIVFVTTALFNAVVDEVPDCFAAARRVLVGGEQLNAVRMGRWYRDNPASRAELANIYGPTECTTFALWHPIPRDFDGAAEDAVPVGRPLPGTGVLLVADGARAAGEGETGEVYLSGAGVAAGYRNRPEETARRFVRLPWHDGGRERWYRTGDLARRDPSGALVFAGRVDRQVKVRGFRIEPAEVERQLAAFPAVRQAHVCTRRDPDGAHELLAYLVPHPGPGPSFDAYREHLAATLPPYMRPHRTHLVERLPLTAQGKTDEAALLASAAEPWRSPRTADGELTEPRRRLLELVEQLLGVTDPRPGDRWVASGGDSLTALRLRYAIRRHWNVDLPQALVLEADFGTLADTAAARAGPSRAEPSSAGPSGSRPSGSGPPGSEAPGAGAAPHPPVPEPAGLRGAPATSEQQRLWLLHQRAPHSRAYDVRLAFRLEGSPDTAALRTALRALVARHPALRTAFRATAEGLLQEVGDPYDPWVPAPAAGAGATRGGEGWREGADRFFAPAFDLGVPRMLRAGLLDHDEERPVLLLHLHHIAVDGWSLNVLFHELSADGARAAGEEPSGPPGDDAPRVTPLEGALWQREWHRSPGYHDQRAALRRHYAALDRPAAPSPRAPEGPGGMRGRLLHRALDAGRRSRLDRLGAGLGLTRFQLLLAVYAWSLYGITGQTRPLVAAPVAGRPVAEFASAVGMFANTVLLPMDLAPDEELRTQLLRQAAAARQVLDRQDVTLADVLTDHRFHDEGAPFDFLFVLENTDVGALAVPGCRAHPLWPEPAEAKCALALTVVERDTGLDCLWEYAEGRVDAERVAAAADLFQRGVDLLTGDAPGTLGSLVAPYRHGLPAPGRGPVSAPGFTSVAEGFARQVLRTPRAPAVTSGDRTLTYAELDAHAAALAARLPVPDGPGDAAAARVALHLPPSAEHVVALLAAARRGLTVVPLDPSYPPALLRRILSRAAPCRVLVAPGGGPDLEALAPGGPPRLTVDLSERPGAVPDGAGPEGSGADGCEPDGAVRRPLYTLFTSGSTGTPKGVDVPDRTLCNLLHWQGEHGGLGGAAVTQQFSALSFDVSFQEIFTTLCSGGRLHLVDPAWRQDMPALLDQLESAGAERIFLPYVALQLLAEYGVRLGRFPSRLRDVVTAGEQLVCTDAIRRWFAGLPGARLFNHYGPTETHVVSGLRLDGDPADWPARPAIGRPVANADLRVVDDGGRPVPPGATGHLLIGGPMAAPCYPGDPELNRERFTELPDGDGMFYRSGDLVRVDGDGLFHYAGRDDDQIKLSGHRVEPGEVEAALLQHPRVAGAAVVPEDGTLVAVLRRRGEADPSAAELTAHLAGLLPGHVRIREFRTVDALPRTPSGKLDRRAAAGVPGRVLPPAGPASRGDSAPRPGPAPPGGGTGARARSAREARLCELFTAVTGKPIEPEQRFFDAGATSLDLMRFHLRCAAEPDLSFTPADLFEHVTVRRLGRALQTPDGDPPAGPAAEVAEAAPSGASGGREHPDPLAIVGMAVRLPGAADLAAFWRLVETGGTGITHFPAAEGLVGARSQLDGPLAFDPDRFGLSRQDARLMDPQQRHLLMGCVEALAHAGIRDPGAGRVGLVAGCGENTYFQTMLREADPAELPDGFRLALHHEKDFLATKAAYHLGLTGPALTTQSACSSSLAAVHVAAGMLRQGDAEVMLAGGVLVDPRLTDGYVYRPQHILSADGRCRPFSDDAGGTVGASGVGVVVLKPLALARRDGDAVYAVVTGSALNNDGSAKAGYSAPSLPGQREVIRTALRRAGRDAAAVGYVEAHGTGTRLGDPVEVGALRQAYGRSGSTDRATCALSSVKSQIGHLGAAAGVVGLVRATLAVHHGLIPPTVGFRRFSPEIGDDPVPFHVPDRALAWPPSHPRVAAVSSFGIGGTNAHLILEHPAEAAEREGAAPRDGACVPGLLVLSAHSATALRAEARRVAGHLTARPETYTRVLRHLQAGRPALAHRAAAVCPDAEAAAAWLRTLDGTGTGTGTAARGHPGDSAPVRPADGPADHGDGHRVSAAGTPPEALAEAWLSGAAVDWPAGPAQAPW
ncbi:non-ribosomal peptide synthetase, partial [Streptomyces boncukensis]|nr:amino acid adenylation domain-containing protein [Streptomyces boncukensis]